MTILQEHSFHFRSDDQEYIRQIPILRIELLIIFFLTLIYLFHHKLSILFLNKNDLIGLQYIWRKVAIFVIILIKQSEKLGDWHLWLFLYWGKITLIGPIIYVVSRTDYFSFGLVCHWTRKRFYILFYIHLLFLFTQSKVYFLTSWWIFAKIEKFLWSGFYVNFFDFLSVFLMDMKFVDLDKPVMIIET